MLAGLRGRFTLAQQTAPFLLYSQCITPFIPLQIPIIGTTCLVILGRMPVKHAKNAALFFFRFRAATKCFSAGIIGGYWVIFF